MGVDGNYPQRWGDYVLVQPLGSGGMGMVFLALRAADQRPCVIKRLNTETVSDRERIERFRREAEISRTLWHAAIARTIDAGEFDGEPFIVQEFVEGKTLAQLTSAAVGVGRRLDPWVIAHIGKEIALALAYAHRSRVVHRDIAPSNVMVDFDGDVRLIDFGLARRPADRSLTATGDFIGRVAYSAPELLAGTTANPRTDIYALGVLLWELLVGRLPTSEELKERPAPSSRVDASPLRGPFESTERLSLPATTLAIPSQLDRIVVRAIAPDPQDRYASADEVAAALHAALPGGYDGSGKLATFVASSYDVPRARELLCAALAEAHALTTAPGGTAQGARRRSISNRVFTGVVIAAVLGLGSVVALRFRPTTSVIPGPETAQALPTPEPPASLPIARSAPKPSSGTPGEGSLDALSPVSAAASARGIDRTEPEHLPPRPQAAREVLPNPSTCSRSKPSLSGAKPAPHILASAGADAGLLLDRARDSLTEADFPQAALHAKQVAEIGTPRQKSAAHLILGKVLLFEGKKNDAAGEFATAVELDPTNNAASDQLATLRRRGIE